MPSRHALSAQKNFPDEKSNAIYGRRLLGQSRGRRLGRNPHVQRTRKGDFGCGGGYHKQPYGDFRRHYGLECLKEPCEVSVYSDSAYTVNAFANRWIYGWAASGWKKADNKPVLNDDLWKRLLKLTEIHRVTFHKVKGHADNEHNNRCDKLATDAIKNYKSE